MAYKMKKKVKKKQQRLSKGASPTRSKKKRRQQRSGDYMPAEVLAHPAIGHRWSLTNDLSSTSLPHLHAHPGTPGHSLVCVTPPPPRASASLSSRIPAAHSDKTPESTGFAQECGVWCRRAGPRHSGTGEAGKRATVRATADPARLPISPQIAPVTPFCAILIAVSPLHSNVVFERSYEAFVKCER